MSRAASLCGQPEAVHSKRYAAELLVGKWRMPAIREAVLQMKGSRFLSKFGLAVALVPWLAAGLLYLLQPT